MTTTTNPATLYDLYENAGACKTEHKDTKKTHRTTNTQRESFASVQDTRISEKRLALQLFTANPVRSFMRADVVDELHLPVNHVTRLIRDLLDEGSIMLNGVAVNPRSGKTVETICLTPTTPNLFNHE